MFKLTLEYDGGAFHGWQAQPGDVRTVARELAAALRTVTGQAPVLVAAGRTDAGAHSLGQVVSFSIDAPREGARGAHDASREYARGAHDAPREGARGAHDRELSPERLMAALNGVLPADVAVVAAEIAPEGFHARFSARSRAYRYLVENREARGALLRGHAWHVRQPLALDAMRRAAAALVGRHDLAAFGSDPAGRNTVRNLETLRIRRLSTPGGRIPALRPALEGGLLSFELRADAFLYGMVRRIVGFLVEVGLGRRSAEEAAVWLSRREPVAARTAPAHGLYQLGVEY
ncbi:MAG TPA: tRNA pseudouridine(38-40) synthase TruA [Candidatus Dormibacteraeota bacterium]|nr:tRNA pseudouridine(38-40) synthase TruA [Candidatus Dormibacteraeota bacterium]